MEADWNEVYVIKTFDNMKFAPGETVRWMNSSNQKLEGVVIGAIECVAAPAPTWVILSNGVIVEVDDALLQLGWFDKKEEIPAQDDEEIPF